MRPKTYLSPGTQNGWRADKPITPKVIWEAVQQAAGAPAFRNTSTPHTLRHSYVNHLLESGSDIRAIEMLPGHADLTHTTVYLHLSQKHLQAAPNPLDHIQVPSTAQLQRVAEGA